MATETMKKEVQSKYEAEAINVWQKFGWQLTDTREDAYCVTLLFQRDTNIAHYSELRSLQKEYDTISEELENVVNAIPARPPLITKFWGAIVAVSLLFGIAGFATIPTSGVIAVVLGLFFLLPAALIIWWRIGKRKKWTATCAELDSRGTTLVGQLDKVLEKVAVYQL